ncbi:DoxX family protein [Promicromonospora sp. NPDC019610]|uniref:DoxX family protein n=1 Tax=Promicromonospora sp. NPDC019610 TaxID=3364405 RepID=UPI00379A3B47
MIIALWILNSALALIFLGAGGAKLTRPKPALASAGMTFVEGFSTPAVKAIGAAEVAGALGLILPLATNIAPALAPLAAGCLTALMIGATVTQTRRHEPRTASVALAVAAATSALAGLLLVD